MTLIVRMEGQSSHLKLVWMDGEGNWSSAPYSVGLQTVIEASKNVRRVLEEFVNASMRGEAPDHRPFLPRLAVAGAALRYSLFDQGGLDGKDAGVKVSAAMGASAERQRLTVISDASAHIPWGFLFCNDPFNLPKCVDTLEDFNGFWLSRCFVVTRFNNSSPLPAVSQRKRDCRVLYALHAEMHKAALRQLSNSEQDQIEQLLGREIGEAHDWMSCREKWNAIQNYDSVFYIYGHSNGQKILLSDDEDPRYQIDAATFNLVFQKENGSQTASICIVNGCRTGEGFFDHSFLTVMARPGFHGFIGTEAEVTNDFAARYGMEFMRRICEEGRSVQDAFEELRATLFPMSLLYACFANPEFRVRPIPKCMVGAPRAEAPHAAVFN
jgi:hypothetical protein